MNEEEESVSQITKKHSAELEKMNPSLLAIEVAVTPITEEEVKEEEEEEEPVTAGRCLN